MRLGTYQACACGSGKLRRELREDSKFIGYGCDDCAEERIRQHRSLERLLSNVKSPDRV